MGGGSGLLWVEGGREQSGFECEGPVAPGEVAVQQSAAHGGDGEGCADPGCARQSESGVDDETGDYGGGGDARV